MHSAPAVSYPVGRSRFHGGVVLGLGLGAGLTGLLWLRQIDVVGWRQWLFFGVWLGACVMAAVAWRHSPRGTLRWDGQAWHWTGAVSLTPASLRAHLDGQFFLLLCLRSDTGKRQWLWPERRLDATRWSALRRAVFSRAAVQQDPSARAALPAANG